MNISIVTTAETDAEGRSLLGHLGMPFRQAILPAGSPAGGPTASSGGTATTSGAA
jgi:hypothetical protein